MAQANGRRHLRVGELNLQLESTKKDYKSKIDSEETEINRVTNLIMAGFEMVEASALVVFHPKERIKKFYYPTAKEGELGDLIREETMQESDFHRNLFEQPAEAAPKENGEEKLDKGQIPNPVIPEGEEQQ